MSEYGCKQGVILLFGVSNEIPSPGVTTCQLSE